MGGQQTEFLHVARGGVQNVFAKARQRGLGSKPMATRSQYRVALRRWWKTSSDLWPTSDASKGECADLGGAIARSQP